MKCEFSEIQYAFGVLFDMTQKINPSKGWFSLIMPTQSAEKDLGYDCKLEGSVRTLFLQFKVPRKLTRTFSKYWGDFNHEYFEFKLWPDSLTPQHNILVSLANKDPRNSVFYCSPAFIKQDEFNDFYCNNTICANSIMVNCKSLICIGGADKHVITYSLNPRKYYMHSDNDNGYSGMKYDEFVNMLYEKPPYESLEQCVSMLHQDINMTYDKNKNIHENLRAISYELLIKYSVF